MQAYKKGPPAFNIYYGRTREPYLVIQGPALH